LFCYTFVSVDSKWLMRGWKIVRKQWGDGGDIGEREKPFEAPLVDFSRGKQGKRARIARDGLRLDRETGSNEAGK
jgi:hypothetical protein